MWCYRKVIAVAMTSGLATLEKQGQEPLVLCGQNVILPARRIWGMGSTELVVMEIGGYKVVKRHCRKT